MQTIETDAHLGKIIYSDRAIQKMKQWGLHTHHIKDTLKHGFSVSPIIKEEGFLQKHYRWNGEKEIDCLFRVTGRDGKSLGAILIVSCWSKNLL